MKTMNFSIIGICSTGFHTVQRIADKGFNCNLVLCSTKQTENPSPAINEFIVSDLSESHGITEEILSSVVSASDCDLDRTIIIVARLGRETGKLLVPQIAATAKTSGVRTIVISVMPFDFEGPTVNQEADDSYEKILQNCDIEMALRSQDIMDENPDWNFAKLFDRISDITVEMINEVLNESKY